jgi:hypothetical protein
LPSSEGYFSRFLNRLRLETCNLPKQIVKEQYRKPTRKITKTAKKKPFGHSFKFLLNRQWLTAGN